jgi:hypothetical protein
MAKHITVLSMNTSRCLLATPLLNLMELEVELIY